MNKKLTKAELEAKRVAKNAYNKAWREANRESNMKSNRESNLRWREKHPERARQIRRISARKNRNENRENYNEYQASYQREMLKDPLNCIAHRMRTYIRSYYIAGNNMARAGKKMPKYLNMSSQEFAKEINRRFGPLRNRVFAHIIPLACIKDYFRKYDLAPMDLVKIGNDIDNLKLLGAKKNGNDYCHIQDDAIVLAKVFQKRFKLIGFYNFVKNYKHVRKVRVEK